MSRLIKWLIGLAVVVAAIYFILVAVTGSQIRSVTEAQLNSYAAQSPEVEISVEWLDTSFWRSVGNIHARMPVAEGEYVEIEHALRFNHGALRARIAGDVQVLVSGEPALNELFNGEQVTMHGRGGLGGLRLTYEVPALNFVDEAAGASIRSDSFSADLVLRDSEQHGQIYIDWIEFGSPLGEVVRIEGMEANSQNRLMKSDGFFEHASGYFSVDRIASGEGSQNRFSVEGLENTLEMHRDGDDITVENLLQVENYQIANFEGHLNFDMVLAPLSFAAFQAMQSPEDEELALRELFGSMQEKGTRLTINDLTVNMGQMGNLVAAGELNLRQDVDINAALERDASAAEWAEGELQVTDLPMLMLMPLMGMVSGELPWRVELRQGELIINGDSLSL